MPFFYFFQIDCRDGIVGEAKESCSVVLDLDAQLKEAENGDGKPSYISKMSKTMVFYNFSKNNLTGKTC